MTPRSIESRIAELERRRGGGEPPIRFFLHPDPCPDAGPDGTCACDVFTLDLGATLLDGPLDRGSGT